MVRAVSPAIQVIEWGGLLRNENVERRPFLKLEAPGIIERGISVPSHIFGTPSPDTNCVGAVRIPELEHTVISIELDGKFLPMQECVNDIDLIGRLGSNGRLRDGALRYDIARFFLILLLAYKKLP
jgi:hypothetical protein